MVAFDESRKQKPERKTMNAAEQAQEQHVIDKAKDVGLTATRYPDEWAIQSRDGLMAAFKTDAEALAFLFGISFTVDHHESFAIPVPTVAIMSGNPFDGMNSTGPFYDVESASEWAEVHADSEWWAISLDKPTP